MKKLLQINETAFHSVKRYQILVYIFLMVFFTITIKAQTAVQPLGSGTAGDPYLVADVNNLYWITQNSSSWDKYFKQTMDINASSIANFSRIGVLNTFSGTYDGDNHTINWLYVYKNDIYPNGMFSITTSTSVIKNLKLTNVNVTTTDIDKTSFGALVGENNGTITNCSSTGSVKGERYTGGLVGKNFGTITNSFSGVTVEDLPPTELDQSAYIGGLVGYNEGNINYSYAAGDAFGLQLVGGLVGESNGTISNCYSTGAVHGSTTGASNYFGGFVGRLTGGSVTNCYSSGGINRFAYGIYYNSGYFNDSHDFIGAITGGSISGSFWFYATFSSGSITGAQVLSSTQIRNADTFLSAGWDFEIETTNGTDDIWDIDLTRTINNGYPYLSWQDSSSVSLTASSPSVSIDSPNITLTNTGPVTYSITFSNAAYISLDASDVVLNKTGTADASISVGDDVASTLTRMITLNSITGNGTLGISLNSGIAFNILNVSNAAAGPSSTFTVDNVVPTLTIGSPSDTTSINGPVTFIITYSGASSVNLTTGDIVLNKTGDADANISITDGTTTNPTVELSNFTGAGTLGISLSSGSSSDDAGNVDAGTGPSETFAVIDQVTPTGSGTDIDPYIIYKFDNLIWVSENPSTWDKYFLQTANIDASPSQSSAFAPIGNFDVSFSGNYDGNGFIVSELYINAPSGDYTGLFGYAGSGAVIENLGLATVNITGGNATGGLAGSNDGTISRCMVNSGSVSGTYLAGGLVGFNTGTITNSYSFASVNGNTYMGGFSGSNTGSVNYCYSTGSVSGSTGIGGFAGHNTGNITHSVWDIETSGRTSSAGGTGKTTSEMNTNTTFQNAGWDENIWYLDSGFNDGYPYLSWENPGGSPLPVELTLFTAEIKIDNTILLHWETATEVNNYGFEVERRETQDVRSETWEKIGFVQGHSNSNSPKKYSFTDKDITAETYNYRLKQIDNDGKFEYSKTIEVSLSTPTEYALEQNYPNPFNPTTKIKFSLPSPSEGEGLGVRSKVVILKVYDNLGSEVATLVNEERPAGNYEIEFNGKNFASGIYFYQLRSGNFIQSKKMVLLK